MHASSAADRGRRHGNPARVRRRSNRIALTWIFSLLCSYKILHSNGSWYMPSGPIPPDPGRDEDPRLVPPWPDWMDDPAYLAGRVGDEDPVGGLDLDEDPEDAPPPEVDPGELAAEAERITGEKAREAAVLAGAGLTATMAADAAAAAGRRGPGMPGSAHPVPGCMPAGRRGSRRVSR